MANSREALTKLLESVQKSKSPGVEATVKDILDQIKEMEKRLENIEDEVVDEKDTKAKALKKAIKEDLEETIDNLRMRLDTRSETLKLSISSSFLKLQEGLRDSADRFASELQKSVAGLGKQFVKNLGQTQRFINAGLDSAAQTILKGVRTITSASSKVIMASLNFSFNALMFFSKTTFNFIKISFSKLTSVVSGVFSAIRSIPGRLKSFFTGLRDDLLGTLVNTIVGAVKFAFRVVAFLIKTTWTILKAAFKFVVTVIWTVGKYIFKAISWVITTALKVLWTAFSFAIKVVWKVVTRVFSFLVSVVWSALKTVVGFVLDVLLATLKLVAMTVLKTAFFVGKVLVKTIANVMMAMFGPWLGLIVLIGVAVFLIFQGLKSFWKSITDTGSKFWSFLTGALNTILGEFWGFVKRMLGIDDKTTFLSFLQTNIEKILGVLKTYILDPIGDMIGKLWNTLVKYLMGSDIIKSVVNWFRDSNVADAIRKAVFGKSNEDIAKERMDLTEKRKKVLIDAGYDKGAVGKYNEQEVEEAEKELMSVRSGQIRSTEIENQSLKVSYLNAESDVSVASAATATAFKKGQALRAELAEKAGGGWKGERATLSPALVLLYDKWKEADEELKKKKDILKKSKERYDAAIKSDPQYETNKQILATINANLEEESQLNAQRDSLLGRPDGARTGGMYNELLGLLGIEEEGSLNGALSKWLLGNEKWDFTTLGGDKGALNAALKWIKELVIGDGGSWERPKEGSPLFGFYNVIFGKNQWFNWNTDDGLIGSIKFFLVDKIAFPILDFLTQKVVPFIRKFGDLVFEAIGKIPGIGSDVAEAGSMGLGVATMAVEAGASGVLDEANRLRAKKKQQARTRSESIDRELQGNIDDATKKALLEEKTNLEGVINPKKEEGKQASVNKFINQKTSLGNYIDQLYGYDYLTRLYHGMGHGSYLQDVAQEGRTRWSSRVKLPEGGNLSQDFSAIRLSFQDNFKSLLLNLVGPSENKYGAFWDTHTRVMNEAKNNNLLQESEINSLNRLAGSTYNFIYKDGYGGNSSIMSDFNKWADTSRVIPTGPMSTKSASPRQLYQGKELIEQFAKYVGDRGETKSTSISRGLQWLAGGGYSPNKEFRESMGFVDLEEGGVVMSVPNGTLTRIGEAGSHEAVVPLNDNGLKLLVDWVKSISDTVNPITTAAGGGPEKPPERESVQTRRQGLGRISAGIDQSNDRFEMTKYISMGLIGK